MVLPITISDVAFLAPVGGPFKSGTSFYIVAQDGSTNTDIKVVKADSDDPSSGWTEQDSSNRPSGSQIVSIHAVRVGTTIHIVSQEANVAGNDVEYHTFNCSTNTWAITNESVTTAPDLTSFCSISVRSDGDIVVAYQGARESNMGTGYDRIDIARREGGTWTADISVDNLGKTTTHMRYPFVVMSANDRAHIFYADATSNDLKYSTYLSGNTWGHQHTDADTSIVGGLAIYTVRAVAFDDGGTEKIRCVYADSTAGNISVVGFDDADSPGSSISIATDITGTETANHNVGVAFTVDDSTDTQYLLSADAINSTSNINESETGSGDDTWSNNLDELTSIDLSGGAAIHSANVYDNSGTVLAYLYRDGSNQRYNERSIGGTTYEGTGTATVTVTATANATIQTPASWDQDSYRFYDDDAAPGSETALAAVNTQPDPIALDTPFRLRVLIQETNNSNQSETPAFRLRYRQNGGSYTTIGSQTNTTLPVRMVLSSHFVDNDAVTQLIGAGTFRDGEALEIAASGDTLAATQGNDEYEVVWNILLDSDNTTPAAAGDVFDFQVLVDTGGGYVGLGSYTVTPTIEAIETATWDQDSFRFYDDDAAPGSATPLAAVNTNHSIELDTAFRLRFLVQVTSDSNQSETPTFRLRYSHNAGGYTLAGAQTNTTLPVRLNLSSHFADADAVSQLLGAGTFRDGEALETDATGTALAATQGLDEYEIEFNLILDSDNTTPAAGGDTFDFRLQVDDGGGQSDLDTYTQTARMTATSGTVFAGTGTATFTIDVTGAATRSVDGTGAVTFDIDATADATRSTTGAADASFDVDASGNATRSTTGAGAVTFDIDATAAANAAKAGAGDVTFTVDVTADATREVGAAAGLIVFDVDATAAASADYAATADASFDVDATANATREVGAAAGAITFDVDMTADGDAAKAGAGAIAFNIDATAAATRSTTGVAIADITVGTVAAATREVGAASGTIAFTVDATANPTRSTIGAGAISFDVDASANANALKSASADASFTVIAVAAGTRSTTGVGNVSFNIDAAAAATLDAFVTADAAFDIDAVADGTIYALGAADVTFNITAIADGTIEGGGTVFEGTGAVTFTIDTVAAATRSTEGVGAVSTNINLLAAAGATRPGAGVIAFDVDAAAIAGATRQGSGDSTFDIDLVANGTREVVGAGSATFDVDLTSTANRSTTGQGAIIFDVDMTADVFATLTASAASEFNVQMNANATVAGPGLGAAQWDMRRRRRVA